MRNTICNKWICIFFCLLLGAGRLSAQFEEGISNKTVMPIPCGTTPYSPSVVYYTATTGETTPSIRDIVRFKIDEAALTGATGSPLSYYKSGFTATANLTIDLWLTTPANGSVAPTTTQTKTLTVYYDSVAGHKYTPIDYVVVSDPTHQYQQVRVTLNSVTVANVASPWTTSNVLSLLSVENEMQVLRYYTFTDPTLLTPTITPTYDATNHSDQLSVSWTFPAGANNNLSQIEYAWIENETQGYYTVNGVFNTNALFQDNSTRVDIDYNSVSYNYNIPLLYDADPAQGGGTLYYRVRAAQRKNDGSLIAGPWSTPQTFTNNGHEPTKNWQSTTSFAENARSHTVIQYYDGSFRERQTVTKDNSTGNTIVAETIYDLQGRPNVQILPTPTIATAIKYYDDFNRFTGQTLNDDPTRYFDLSLPGTQCSASPALDTTKGNGLYYSAGNPWIGVESMSNYIPDAKGFGYAETRYTDDPTGRTSVQGGVGPAYQVGNGHATKYYYGKPTQNELDALFGTEAGDASHYFKNMVQDANGQMSVTYVDMHGRTVATALAGANPSSLSGINNNTAFYPVSSGLLTNNLLTPSTNVVKGDSIQSISTILVPATTLYNFTYQLTPDIFHGVDTAGNPVCFDCKYDLTITVRPEDCDNTAVTVKHFSNLQIEPANLACGTPMGFIGDSVSSPTTQLQFPITLAPGSYVVTKTLAINDSLFKIREDSALKVFLKQAQQHLTDSVFAALSTATGCSVASQPCSTCLANLGTYATYKTNFLASLGGTSTLTDAAIHAQYTQDSLACADACGTTLLPALTTLGQLRNLMLSDMMPDSGQYASLKYPIDPTSIESKYNIFTSTSTGNFGSFGTKPFYQNPVSEPNGAPSYYMNSDGSTDATLYPNGNTDPSYLNSLNEYSYAGIYNPAWAEQMIYYHPEYCKLRFAEDTLTTSYAWLDKVLNCDTYASASTNGYLDPIHNDPFFTNNYVPADADTMTTYLTVSINPKTNSGYSIWRIANGMALADSTWPLSVREFFMQGMDSLTIDPAAYTTAQQDAVWRAFRSEYLSLRNEMVLNYINAHESGTLSYTAMAALQAPGVGKQLRFATAQALAAQNGWTWWSTATNRTTVDSIGLINQTSAYVASMNLDACVAQRPLWQAKLMQCELLQDYLLNQTNSDTVTVNTIIGVILDSMVMVCHNSIDNNDPAGASTVNPSKLPVVPSSFENIINHVFAQYNIATPAGGNYFCNPYSVDYPKPYGSNPPLFVTVKNTVDTCNCKQYHLINVAANAAGYDTTQQSSMNTYLLATYNDTLSLTLWTGLQQCGSATWAAQACRPYVAAGLPVGEGGSGGGHYVGEGGLGDTCQNVYANIPLSASVIVPAFLSCGYVPPCVTCYTLQTYTQEFRTMYPAFSAVPYTTGLDTGMANQNALWARFLNFRTGFSKNPAEYVAAYLSCNLNSDPVVTGTIPTDLDLTSRSSQPPSGTTPPYYYAASNSITFDAGYSSLSTDNFVALITSTTGPTGSTATALCAMDQPVTYIQLPDTTGSNRCAQVQEEANYIGMMLFQKLQDSLTSNFDSLYRAKCLGAQSSEVFYATYQPSEYHYTLYYYDQAGNLVKTLAPAAVKPNFNATYLASVQTNRAAGTDLSNGTNIENMAAQYRFNTLNQVIAQNSPDGGKSLFWYDRLGRLAVSQNAKQALYSTPAYSYTMYDVLGRITEVGEKPQTNAMSQATSQDTTLLKNWLADVTTGGSAKEQITRTVYDVSYPGFAGTVSTGTTTIQPPIAQVNLRNRVAYTQVIDVDNTNATPYRAATFYSYDPHGNVDTLLQDYGVSGVMYAAGNRFKITLYDYDLVSGKVNQVRYQPGSSDAFYHQYQYDAENRLTSVMTSPDSVQWENDAAYFYYRHGPLARTQLGSLQVQGIDYAYTLQGWLKSINPSNVSASGDLFDADGTGSPVLFGRDAYKLNLHYFDDGTYADFQPIAPPSGYVQGNTLASGQRRNLYNGNIGSMAVNIRKLSGGTRDTGPMIYNYQYDQLNRLVSMDPWAANGSFTPIGSSALPDFAERYTYDPNGNILTLSRNGDSSHNAMDNLTYNYLYAKTGGGVGEYTPGAAPTTGVDHLTNQLSSINDAVGATSYYPNDIENQSAY
ncbi:MAG: DUF6443 domain-containing protein, partial [Puia sp.]|nr:DUF6443 domain-containing protein [Puia sp.]